MEARRGRGDVRIGISGWSYPGWRGVFYPQGLRHADELAHAAACFTSIEVNGTFYSLRRPDDFRSWRERTPDGFELAVKGGRFITHLKKLADVETPLANFFASGPLALGDRLGPVLWQLPPVLAFDPDRLRTFFDLLPRTTVEAAELAARHDGRVDGRAWLEPDGDRPIRHVLEVRHASFADPAATRLLRDHGIGLVVADTAGRWPLIDEVTSDLVYVRLHGETGLYAGGYSPASLEHWAGRVRGWAADGLDVRVYFDNDMDGRAPFDAMELIRLVRTD